VAQHDRNPYQRERDMTIFEYHLIGCFDKKGKTGDIPLSSVGFSSAAVTVFLEHNETIVISSGQGEIFLTRRYSMKCVAGG
jgi:hypothetical protein